MGNDAYLFRRRNLLYAGTDQLVYFCLLPAAQIIIMANDQFIKYSGGFLSQCPDIFIAAVAHPRYNTHFYRSRNRPDKRCDRLQAMGVVCIINNDLERIEIEYIHASGSCFGAGNKGGQCFGYATGMNALNKSRQRCGQYILNIELGCSRKSKGNIYRFS